MRVLYEPEVSLVWATDEPLAVIERIGRTCYRSEGKIEPGSAEPFVRRLIARGHLAMIEHVSASLRIVCDRGVTHELVRHRLFSFAQESTRYCDYSRGQGRGEEGTKGTEGTQGTSDGSGLRFFWPFGERESASARYGTGRVWADAMRAAEMAYLTLRGWGVSPQLARSVLPNALASEIVVTGNAREWRHFLGLRLAAGAHPQMREVARRCASKLSMWAPVLFSEFVGDQEGESGNG